MQDVTFERWKHIGGSDICIIMGISPFKTRWQLLQEKAQIIEPEHFTNPQIEFGNRLEPVIRDYVNKRYNTNFIETKKEQGYFRYHADGDDAENLTLLEIKTTSQIYDTLDGYKKYLVQLLTGMEIYNYPRGLLAVYDRPEDFDETFDPSRLQIFEIHSCDHKELLEEILSQADRFWDDVLKLRDNPFLTEEDLLSFELVALSDSVLALENKLIAYKQIEEQYKAEKEALKQAMQNHGVKKWTTNSGVKITLVEDGKDTTVKKFNEKKFKEENPELYTMYEEDVVKKSRTGYVRISL